VFGVCLFMDRQCSALHVYSYIDFGRFHISFSGKSVAQLARIGKVGHNSVGVATSFLSFFSLLHLIVTLLLKAEKPAKQTTGKRTKFNRRSHLSANVKTFKCHCAYATLSGRGRRRGRQSLSYLT